MRSKILNPCSSEGVDGLEMMTVIDLRTMHVIHSEACHPDHWVAFDGGGEVAKVLTLVGIDADGGLVAFSHDGKWAGDGELELWDVAEPRSFAKFLAPMAAASQVGLRGDGNALTCWSGSHKSGDEWYDDYKEYLLDWRYRVPDDPNWNPKEQKLIWDKRAKRDREKKRLEEQRRKEEQRWLEEERQQEEWHRQEEVRRREEEGFRCREEELQLEEKRKVECERERILQEIDDVQEQIDAGYRQLGEKQREYDDLGFFKGKEKKRLKAEIAELDKIGAQLNAKIWELRKQLKDLG